MAAPEVWIPFYLGHAVVAEHPLGALRHRRLVLGQRLYVGGRRAEQRLQKSISIEAFR